MPDHIESFVAATGDWIAVFANPEAAPSAEPWIVEPIIGWAVVLSELNDGSSVGEILPVIGGEFITVSEDWIGCYRRSDLQLPQIRQALIAKCRQVEADV